MKGENTNKNSSSGLPKNSVTKQYLKKELKLVETKLRSDLASKQDLKNLETNLRSEMREMQTELRSETHNMGASLQGQITRIENKINTEMATKDDINRIITYMDKFMETSDNYRKQDLMRGEAIITHSDQLQNHENRIKLLESAKK